MVKLRALLSKLLALLAVFGSLLLSRSATAQTTLTTIRDTVNNSNGTPFNGSVNLTWNAIVASSGNTVAPHSTSTHIYNGLLYVLLVPTVDPQSGLNIATYTAVYSSNDGLTTWTETWQVPQSNTPLTLSQVRQSGSGSSGGGGGSGSGGSSGGITLPIPISGVTNLAPTLASINLSITGLQNSVSNITSNNPLFIDGETPSGLVNGANTAFTLANAPSPVTSLEIFRNGLVQTIGVDYTISGSTITFVSLSTPQTGDTLQAFYRAVGTGQAATFTDAETPAGLANGTNVTFTLSVAPFPTLSLKLFKNGTLMRQNADYSLSGLTITFASPLIAPHSGDVLVAYYRH